MAQNETGGPCQNLRKLKRMAPWMLWLETGDWERRKESRKPTIGQIPILAFSFQLSRVEVLQIAFNYYYDFITFIGFSI